MAQREPQEIAAVLGVSSAVVRQRLRRALRALRDNIDIQPKPVRGFFVFGSWAKGWSVTSAALFGISVVYAASTSCVGTRFAPRAEGAKSVQSTREPPSSGIVRYSPTAHPTTGRNSKTRGRLIALGGDLEGLLEDLRENPHAVDRLRLWCRSEGAADDQALASFALAINDGVISPGEIATRLIPQLRAYSRQAPPKPSH
ncbi:MAG: hypothetical protein B7733_22580 [Myxococcales bacterium FL481]|nr:MAG: hypothetical protein B7733_22580 [Myxococcales bacterium FL481]